MPFNFRKLCLSVPENYVFQFLKVSPVCAGKVCAPNGIDIAQALHKYAIIQNALTYAMFYAGATHFRRAAHRFFGRFMPGNKYCA